MAEPKRKKDPLEHLKPKNPVRQRNMERDQPLATRKKNSKAVAKYKAAPGKK